MGGARGLAAPARAGRGRRVLPATAADPRRGGRGEKARELLGALTFDAGSGTARVHAASGAVPAGRTGHGLAAEVVRVISEDSAAVEAYLVECSRPAGVVQRCPTPVVDVFLAPRLDPGGVRGLGTLPMGTRQTTLVVDRALGDA